ncbi:LLM class flavin-dependent oxidoreductase [Psychroflexus halocasei]|uniref:Luciferase-like monooxygenase n=1 Tax=Psychroflexus halocasei TaxID=908615 RepID=A0A1H3VFM4_9FLAO|nr:LLM class flavin-dependent oxidoreductase [Psychroflexus halocasei]SDZ73034.1 hypothetical protein SAMN05421540_10136 [Psychroflexus halocasei]
MTKKLKEVAFSILELAAIGEGLKVSEVLQNSLCLAQHAEALGYKRFWLAEHHNMKSIASSATSVLIGYIAQGTSEIRVGSGGVMLPNHSPLIVAEQFGTLGHLYPDRIDLGLGRAPGTDQRTAQAIRSDRLSAVHSFPNDIQEIQNYFSKSNKNSSVRSYLSESVEVPIFILGSSTDSAYLAAKKGLPYVFASHFAPAQLQNALQIYHQNFQASQYLNKPYTIAGINVIAADTTEEALHLSTSMYKMILGVLTQNMNYLQKPTAMTSEVEKLRNHPSVKQMLKYAFVGNKTEVKEQTQNFVDRFQVDELILTSYIYDQSARLRSFEIFSELMKT